MNNNENAEYNNTLHFHVYNILCLHIIDNLTPAEVKHWHGATKDSFFSHLAIEVPAVGGSNEWLEPVTDEEYLQLK